MNYVQVIKYPQTYAKEAWNTILLLNQIGCLEKKNGLLIYKMMFFRLLIFLINSLVK
jgi:hypothetical protein